MFLIILVDKVYKPLALDKESSADNFIVLWSKFWSKEGHTDTLPPFSATSIDEIFSWTSKATKGICSISVHSWYYMTCLTVIISNNDSCGPVLSNNHHRWILYCWSKSLNNHFIIFHKSIIDKTDIIALPVTTRRNY